jgi:hypothetical protein
MRRLFSILALLILVFATDSFAQFGNSRAILTSTSSGRNVNITASPCGVAEVGFAGIIICRLDGVANTPFYCLDLCTGISVGDTTKDSASTIPQAIYITNNYFPAVTNSPGRLASDNEEACAVQLAIWHFRNGVDTNEVTDIQGTTNDRNIKVRVMNIIADVLLNGGSTTHVSTIEIKPGENFDEFFVETRDTSGAPIAVNNIQLSITGSGILSTSTVNTGVNGESPRVTVSGGVTNGDIISATATLQIPGGVTYASLRPLTSPKQLLVLGRTTIGQRSAQITWGALPVELSSFSAVVYNRTAELSWKTSEEVNNSGFEVERKASDSQTWEKVGFVEGHGTTTTSYIYTFADRNLATGSYNYRLKQIDYNGNFEYHNLSSEVVIGTPVSFELSQNFPNPFNPETKINFQIPTDGFVSLKVFDNSGKEVATLVNQSMTAGFHTTNFNASSLSSGVYFYRLETQGFVKVMKMALVK